MALTRRDALKLGGLAAVALKGENPVVGGTVLRRAAIESPNFVAGSTGWIIRQDGSAEFNNVVIRNGQIVSGTSLYYSSTPAAGNLIASVSATSGTDAEGNAYLAGVTNYTTSAPFIAANMDGGTFAFLTAASQAGPWFTAPFIETDGSGNLVLDTAGLGQVRAASQFFAELGIEIQGGGTISGDAGGDLTIAPSGAGSTLTITNTSGGGTVITTASAGDEGIGVQVAGDAHARFKVNGNGGINFSNGTNVTDTTFGRIAAGEVGATSNTSLAVATAGQGLRIAEGSNAKQGVATLVAGSVVVANTSVTANSKIFVGQNTPGGTVGAPFVSSVTAGTGFTIKSTSNLDTSTVGYFITEPA